LCCYLSVGHAILIRLGLLTTTFTRMNEPCLGVYTECIENKHTKYTTQVDTGKLQRLNRPTGVMKSFFCF